MAPTTQPLAYKGEAWPHAAIPYSAGGIPGPLHRSWPPSLQLLQRAFTSNPVPLPPPHPLPRHPACSAFQLLILMQGEIFPPQPGEIRVHKEGVVGLAPSLPPLMAQTMDPPQLFWFKSSCQHFPTDEWQEGGPSPLLSCRPYLCLSSNFSWSLPHYSEEKRDFLIRLKKLYSKLSSTRVFRLARLLNCLEFLFQPVFCKENLKHVCIYFMFKVALVSNTVSVRKNLKCNLM